VQPDLAGKILDTKLKNVIATSTDQVVTANPGCMMQIEMGLLARGITGKVLHVVDLLDEAYQAEATSINLNPSKSS
jgi:glycolate oxidase iron-sulfur subunit